MSIFENNPWVVGRERYDDLIRKEALLEYIERLYDRTSDFVFRDAVGHLLHTAPVERKSDE